MSTLPSVSIGVPVYRAALQRDEAFALRHLNRHLAEYPLAWIAPDGLDLSAMARWRPDARTLRFHPDYFRSARDYSRLLLSEAFYRAFADHEFLLIHQLDALVFSDQLAHWCARGDDYVGAPWIKQDASGHRWATGNSGFGLRRIDGMLRVLTSRRFSRAWPAGLVKHLAHIDQRARLVPERMLRRLVPVTRDLELATNRWANASIDDVRRRMFWTMQGGVRQYLDRITYPEDVFWAQVAPVFDRAYRVTPPDLAVRFAFEKEPRWCYEQTGRQLPFGCHAWWKYDRAFWEPFLIQ